MRSRMAVRLDEADPVAAWREHTARQRARCAQLDALALRRAPLRRAGNRSHRRPVAGVAVDRRRDRDARRDRARPEPADRRGLHRPGLAPHRGHRSLDAPARARRDSRARPRADVRRRRSGGRTGFERRRGRARADGHRRVREAARRGRARRRHLACRTDRHHLLQHALRRERDVPHRLGERDHVLRARARRALTGREASPRRERLERAHGLHGRRPRGRRRRHHQATASVSRS